MQVALELMLLEMLQQGAARAVHDAFGNAGRAGGIENIDRMIEGQALIDDRPGRGGLEIVFERNRARQLFRHRRRVAEIGHDHDRLRGGELRHDRLELVGDANGLAVVPVAVGGDE